MLWSIGSASNDAFIKLAMHELDYFKALFEHERQRCEMLTDELLRVRIQAGPVTQPTPREAREQESMVEKMLRDTEFSSAGEVELT